MMKYRDLKQVLSRMTDEELQERVLIYNPFYDRSFTASTIDHIESFKHAKQVPNDKLAIIIYNGQ